MVFSSKKVILALIIAVGVMVASSSLAADPMIERLQAQVMELQKQIAKLLLQLQNIQNATNINETAVPTSCKRCGDGTECGAKNPLGQTCKCWDTAVGGITENNTAGIHYKCALSPAGRCKACSDGTPCGQISSSGVMCSCDRVIDSVAGANATYLEGVYTGCRLSKELVCKRCKDNTECDQVNSLGQKCQCKPIAPESGYNHSCTLSPASRCDKCSDGTACGNLSSGGKICACNKISAEGAAEAYVKCTLSEVPTCKRCSDNTECGAKNPLGQTCKCHAPWGENNAASAYNTVCKLTSTDKCVACADGTACGTFNKGQLCTCDKTDAEGIYKNCIFRAETTCKGCSDGTPCGQTNSLGQGCKCTSAWANTNTMGSAYYTACGLTLTNRCIACKDGTACGSLNAGGKACSCQKTDKEGVYQNCHINEVEVCKRCSDNTECGQANAAGQKCVCGSWGSTDILKDGGYYPACKLSPSTTTATN